MWNYLRAVPHNIYLSLSRPLKVWLAISLIFVGLIFTAYPEIIISITNLTRPTSMVDEGPGNDVTGELIGLVQGNIGTAIGLFLFIFGWVLAIFSMRFGLTNLLLVFATLALLLALICAYPFDERLESDLLGGGFLLWCLVGPLVLTRNLSANAITSDLRFQQVQKILKENEGILRSLRVGNADSLDPEVVFDAMSLRLHHEFQRAKRNENLRAVVAGVIASLIAIPLGAMLYNI